MAKSHKAQHWIPRSYLRSWADPSAPGNHEPYVHVFSKDGVSSRKKAPINLFTETDLYTIQLPDGGRDLRLEHGLCGLESSFSEIRRDFLSKRKHLPALRHLKLTAFVAAMHSRTPSRRDHHMAFWNEVLEMGEQLESRMKTATLAERERAASASIATRNHRSMSLDDVRKITSSPMEHTLGPHMAAELPLLIQMRCRVLCTSSKIGFISSDAPVVWFDPEWHKKPPLFRSPSFSDPQLEITLPVSPSQALIFTHGLIDRERPISYVDIPDHAVTEINRRTRFLCDKEFISRTQTTESRWFELGTLPPDAWELNEGKELMKERDC
ncbi:DUF4238 domain-containing protein [Tardiphaga sp. 862_B3_N1_1]|uniref:DUF4238 domain-containing protein n=1 Tax=Tardiphaga sp. 862_B3_N1_1 TaxID=3240763 RepID=UPI003F8CB2FF